jgi:ankyrin repeat protein
MLHAEGFTPLHVSALLNTQELCRYMLSSNHLDLSLGPGLVRAHSEAGLTPLHISAIVDDVPSTELFLAHNGDPSAQDKRGRTPLHFAAACGSIHVLELLLSYSGHDALAIVLAKASNQDGLNPIHIALSNGQIESARLLLRFRADPNARTISGQTALHFALQFCPEAIEQVLLAGASTSLVSNNGRTALHWACVTGGAIQVLSRGQFDALDPNLQDHHGSTPLHILAAADKEQIDYAKWLTKMGVNPNIQDNKGFTPLHLALANGHFELARYLLSTGAFRDLASKDGSLPAFIAAGRENCPKSLLMALIDGDPNRKTAENVSLLHAVVQRQNAEEVHALINLGADVNARNAVGETPLHIAARQFVRRQRFSSARRTRSNIVSLLLHGGADPSLESDAGYNPLQIALIRDFFPLLSMMLRFSNPTSIINSTLPGDLPTTIYAALYSSPQCLELFLSRAGDEEIIEQTLAALRRLIRNLTSEADSDSQPVDRIYRDSLGLSTDQVKLSLDSSKCDMNEHHHGPCKRFKDTCVNIVLLISYQSTVRSTQEYKDLSKELAECYQVNQLNTSKYAELPGNCPTLEGLHSDGEMTCSKALKQSFAALTNPELDWPILAEDWVEDDYTWEDLLPLCPPAKTPGTSLHRPSAPERRRRTSTSAHFDDGRRPTLAASTIPQWELATYEVGRTLQLKQTLSREPWIVQRSPWLAAIPEN